MVKKLLPIIIYMHATLPKLNNANNVVMLTNIPGSRYGNKKRKILY
jgi:hypothetical protein